MVNAHAMLGGRIFKKRDLVSSKAMPGQLSKGQAFPNLKTWVSAQKQKPSHGKGHSRTSSKNKTRKLKSNTNTKEKRFFIKKPSSILRRYLKPRPRGRISSYYLSKRTPTSTTEDYKIYDDDGNFSYGSDVMHAPSMVYAGFKKMPADIRMHSKY